MKVFENATFISCEDSNRIFKVLVEDQGKIAFTGDALPAKYAGVKSRIDLKNQCVLPAFIDTHMHFASFAMFENGLNVRYAKDFRELEQIISTYSDNHPKEKIMFGFGISAHTVKEGRLATRAYHNDPDNTGILVYTQEQVNDFVMRANRAGLQISLHAIGDAAVEQAITAYEGRFISQR
jgi:predicted amidohydrolase YtcJ